MGEDGNKGRIPCDYLKDIEDVMVKSEVTVYEFSAVCRLTNEIEKDCLTTE